MKNAIEFNLSRPIRIRREAGVTLILLVATICAVAYVWAPQWDPAAEHVQAGRKYILLNNGSAAENEWKEATRANRNNAEAWSLLAEYYTRIEHDDAAVEPLRQIARLRPETPHIYDRLASVACKSGDPRSTLRDAEALLQRDPNDAGAIAIAAKALTSLDDEQRRLDYLRRLVKLRPVDIDCLVLLARSLTNAHLYDEASPLIDRILRLDINSADAYGLRGRKWLDTGNSSTEFAQAEADFQKVLELNPGGPMPHLHLGKLYLRTGKTDLAIKHLEQAARSLPRKPEVFFTLAAAFSQAKLPDQAAAARIRFAALREQEDLRNSLEKRCSATPNDFALHLQMGLLALETGDFEKADYYLNRARTLRPGDPRSKAALKRLAAVTGENEYPVPGVAQLHGLHP